MIDSEEMKAEIARLRRLEGFRRDPLGFVRWAFPWDFGEGDSEGGDNAQGPLAGHPGPEKWQEDILRQIGEGLRAEEGPVRIAVASGHGVGKSALVAWLLLWAMATQPSTRGVVTANTETQLKTKTWAELGKWHRLALSHDWCQLGATSLLSAVTDSGPSGAEGDGGGDGGGGGRIDMVPWAATNPEAFAGLHNKGSRVVLVFDEASAIADPIWETTEGALTDAGTEIVWIVFGNPTRASGRFFECFNRFRDRWRHAQVDSRTVSLTDKRQLARWVADYGEDSDFVKVRVLGRFPKAGNMQFIDADRVDAAMARLPDPPMEHGGDRHQPLVMGVDVARFGDDRSVIFLRKGRDARSWKVEKHQGLDTMTLASRVVERATAEQAAAVFVDEGGVGAGVVDRLRQLGLQRVFGVNFGGAAQRFDEEGAKPRYANKRAEMWGDMKQWLEQGCLAPDPELRADLTGLDYGYNGKGEIQLEKKEDMKKRGLASPDIADALALTFAFPVPPGWDLPQAQAYCVTEYDIDRDFTDEYWDEKDEYDE